MNNRSIVLIMAFVLLLAQVILVIALMITWKQNRDLEDRVNELETAINVLVAESVSAEGIPTTVITPDGNVITTDSPKDIQDE